MIPVETILLKILHSTTANELFTYSNYKKEYIEYVKLIHPDICKLPLVHEANTKLNTFKIRMDNLYVFKDDAGEVRVRDNKQMIIKGTESLLSNSFSVFNELISKKDTASLNFRKYLPKNMSLSGDELVIDFENKIIPLQGLTLAREHATWVLSRLLEFTSWFHQIGLAHLGFVPESFVIVPETHGIIVVSFYHIAKLNQKASTVSAKYYGWYLQILFDTKKAHPSIDLSMIMRTAIHLLGDKSGSGIVLRKTEKEALVDFLISNHEEAFETYDFYRSLLFKLYGKPVFHELKI